MGKARGQRESREQLVQEAQVMVAEDFPQELEAIYAKTSEKANISAMKVLNMAKCLELLEVEMAGGHTVLLIKVSQVVKTGNMTIEITPNSASFGNSILQRVSRFDSALQVSKEGPKIRVVLPPITTARRDRTVEEVKNLISIFRQLVKQSRTRAVKVLQDAGLEDGVQRELVAVVDSTASAFLAEKAAELELLSEEVMSMGIDESDVTAGR
ncbi:putative Ribosome recycling factor [Leishmania shawi]